MIITLTPSARDELASLLSSKNAEAESGLRLAVRRGGCAGWQYEMRVAPVSPGDIVQQEGAARVIIAGDSIDRLRGCEIDYSDDLTDAGFKVHNPNAARSCGCGTSFEADDGSGPAPVADGTACGDT